MHYVNNIVDRARREAVAKALFRAGIPAWYNEHKRRFEVHESYADRADMIEEVFYLGHDSYRC